MVYFVVLAIALFAPFMVYKFASVDGTQLKLSPGIVALSLAGLWSGFCGVTIIPGGNVGVQTVFGSISLTPLTEGSHVVLPWSDITTVSARMVSTKLEGASGGSKDLQQVHTDIVLNYRLRGEQAAHIFKEYGFDLRETLIKPVLNESFKAVTAKHTSEELITKRDIVSAEIKDEFAEKMNKYGISVEDVSLVNFSFNPDYQKAVEEKVIATQSKLKAEQDLARIKVEAEQAIAKAEGNAKAIKIQVEAINTQGGASYVELKKVEKWDGKLPTTIAGQSTPFLNIGK